MRKKKWLYGLIVVFMLVAVNIFLPKWNRGQTYYAVDLPSELCIESYSRTVENLNRTGYLTFGPYKKQEAGTIEITIFYKTDTEGNWIDVSSHILEKTFQKIILDSTKKKMVFEAEIDEDITDLEIRSYYNGNGYLQIEKIIVTERVKELQIIIFIYNLIFLAGIIGWGGYCFQHQKKLREMVN